MTRHPTPSLSIVIATRNAARTLEQCLRSVAAQTFEDWEILIADGASTDGTIDLIRQYEAEVGWWQSRGDSGIYDAWNQALAHARGKHICFLGADDTFADRDALTRLYAAIGTNEYDLVTSRGMVLRSDDGHGVGFGSAWDYERIGRRMVICHPGMLHGRWLFDRYGRFDTRYRIAADLDFLLRLPQDLRTLHVDSVTVHLSAGGVSRRQVLRRLREQRDVLARSERHGPVRAYLAWLDKLWRYPVARLLNIPH